MTPSSLSTYVVFMVLSRGINDTMPPIAKGIYDRSYKSANNKDRHTCNACIVKSTNGSKEN